MSVSTPNPDTRVPPARNARPKILGFVCEWSLGRTDLLHQDGSVRGLEHIKTIRIPCSGFVKPEWVQVGFENGAQGVFILGCPLGDCHFNEGNIIISERLTQLRKRLVGRKTIDDENRIAELYLGATERGDFMGMMQDFSDYVGALPELAPPVKKARAARGDAAKPAAPAAKPEAATVVTPEAGVAAPATTAAVAAEPGSPEALAAQRVGPSPAKSADPDAALQAHQDTAPVPAPVDPATANVDPSPVTNEPLAAGSTPAPAPAATTPPSAPAPATDGERPRKQYKRWEPKKDGDQ